MVESADISITVEKREVTGTTEVGRLRRAGLIPAVVYGGGKPPVSIVVEDEDIRKILKSEAGENTIFLLKLKGGKEERRAMIKEMQQDPVTGRILHLDFIRVMRGHKLNVTVRIDLVGDCVGVRHGGRIDFITREPLVEVLPREMFDRIEVDVSDLDVGDRVTIGDLVDRLPESARFMEDESRVVVLVEAPRVGAEEEGEAGEESVIAEQAEPEVIARGKEEDESE
jgi:large subunit ribosomal protein L25